jgi:ankyrin repeat protein
LDTEEPTKFADIFEAISPLGTVEDLQYFIEKKGVNVNVKNEKGLTPLLLAAFHGNIKQVEFLVSNGADIHASATNGFNAFHWLAWGFGLFDDTKHIETADFLFLEGVDVKAKNNEGNTPVDLAIKCGYEEMVQCLKSMSGESDKDSGGGVGVGKIVTIVAIIVGVIVLFGMCGSCLGCW